MTKQNNQYLNPKRLYDLVCECLDEDELKPELVNAFILLVDKVMLKNYYSDKQDKEDCRSGAILSLLKAWKKFDPTKTTNAFSFFTTCVKNGLIVSWNEIHPEKIKGNVSLEAIMEAENERDY